MPTLALLIRALNRNFPRLSRQRACPATPLQSGGRCVDHTSARGTLGSAPSASASLMTNEAHAGDVRGRRPRFRVHGRVERLNPSAPCRTGCHKSISAPRHKTFPQVRDVAREGLEPPTLRFPRRHVGAETQDVPAGQVGGEGRNRTVDTAVFSRVLCQLSYLARWRRVCASSISRA
jgi:hypothetical protein